MTITPTLYDTHTLIAVIRMTQDVQNYWLDLCFQAEIHSDNEFIDFEKVSDVRRIAPFVAPMVQGKPIYQDGSTVARLTPAYIKVKDPVSPLRVIKKRPGTLLDPNSGGTIQSRYDSIVADIVVAHRKAIERRWEWMAARAVIDAQVTISGEAYPERVVNFGRNANQTVVLTSGSYWGETGVSIKTLIQTWRTRIRRALFGGVTNRITMGPDAWAVMQSDEEILDLLKLDKRPYNANLDMNLGFTEGLEVEYVGTLGAVGVQLWVYSDYYQSPADGSVVTYMSSKDMVLTGPNLLGTRCFGAILDPNAQFQPLSIFPRQYREDDPPNLMILTQSSPLMVPINPNCSLKATVVP